SYIIEIIMAKILLAEDDLFLRDVYLETLRGEGFDVTAAIDGQQAFDAISLGGWDLVLLDVVMPVMNGVDVLKKLRDKSPKKLAKHILFMTNSDINSELNEVMDLTDGFLLKSAYTPEQLVAQIKDILNK
ncbi:MAG: response regulator transcription factor, partial [Candidatus Levyibacteriota bacterium]